MAISFTAAADLGNNGGAGSGYTVAYTCGSGTDRLLVVGFLGDNSADDITSVTYAGAAMTLVGKVAGTVGVRWTYMYYLLNPASGSNNVVISSSSTKFLIACAGDWAGVNQTGQPDASDTATLGSGNTSLTKAVTTIANNCWTILVSGGYDANNSPAAGTGSTRRTFDATFGGTGIFDSNAPITPAGSYSMTWTYPIASSGMNTIIASFAPTVAAGQLFARPALDGLSSAGKQFTRIS